MFKFFEHKEKPIETEAERPEPIIVGAASPKRKEEIKEVVAERFGKLHMQEIGPERLKELKRSERRKTAAELRMIENANYITNRLLNELGMKPFNFPSRNVHFISGKLLRKYGIEEGVAGFYSPKRQAIFMDGDYAKENPAITASNVLHEVIHSKQFLSIEASEEESTTRRSGLQIFPSLRKRKKRGEMAASYFEGLLEAVTSKIEMQYFPEMLKNNPYLKQELDWLESREAQELKDEIAKEFGVSKEEIRWVSRDKKWELFTYHAQRRVLDFVIDAIYEDGRFSSKDEIFRKFIEANFSGRLLPIAQLIEGAFGKESFRVLGMMDYKRPESAGQVLDFLAKRRRLLKSKNKR